MSRASGQGRGVPRVVAVIGAGYVGLPTAATLASFGHSVTLAEREPTRLAALRSGRMPIVEIGLDELVADAVAAGRLRLTDSSTEAVNGAEFVFLCVATPQSEDGSADLSFVEAAAKEIGSSLKPGAIVVNKSTVPVGSATMVEQVIGRSDIAVVSNPEFLREGTAVVDSLNPDRIVVGADDPEAAAKVGELFATTGAPLIVTDATTSETIK
jgi:UDPglucose 6-dehydrogenase